MYIIFDPVIHPEGYSWIDPASRLLFLSVIIFLLFTYIFMQIKKKEVGVQTAFLIGLAYSGYISVFVIVLLILTCVIFYWNEDMSLLLFLPHFVIGVLITLFTWALAHRSVKSDYDNVDGRMKSYREQKGG